MSKGNETAFGYGYSPTFDGDLDGEIAELRKDAERYRFLKNMACCSMSIGLNEGHAINYTSFEQYAEECPEQYDCVPYDVLERMKQANTDWSIQIYPETPIGFYVWHGDTLDVAIDRAMDWKA